MSPEVIGLDEMPTEEEGQLDGDIAAGTVPCPECGNYYKSRGLTRHMVNAHGMEPPAGSRAGTSGTTRGKGTAALATKWAEFQRGAALLVSFACTSCAGVLVEDAAKDGEAIATFCENRPKLRKQLQQALDGMDLMLLIAALGGTAQKMVSHHAIGAKIGLGDGHTHNDNGGGPQERVMSFLSGMDEDSRNALINGAFDQMRAHSAQQAPTTATTTERREATVQRTVVMDDEVPGQPPVVVPEQLSPQDRYQMMMAHAHTDDLSVTVPG